MIGRDVYLHAAIVRRTTSGKYYLVEGSDDFGYWMEPLQGDKVGAPVSKRFILENFDLVKESSYAPARQHVGGGRLLAAPGDTPYPEKITDVIDTKPPYDAKPPWRNW